MCVCYIIYAVQMYIARIRVKFEFNNIYYLFKLSSQNPTPNHQRKTGLKSVFPAKQRLAKSEDLFKKLVLKIPRFDLKVDLDWNYIYTKIKRCFHVEMKKNVDFANLFLVVKL